MSEAAPASGEEAPKGFRFVWLDYVRGLNILSVVFVHVWRGLVTAGVAPASPGVTLVLDSIAPMALFFFISGMFVSRAVDLPFREFLSAKLKDFVYPYAIWVTLHGLIHAAAGGSVNSEHRVGDLLTAIYDPPWHYWFLYNLFLAHMLYFAVRRLRITAVWFLVFAVAVYLTGDFPGLTLGPWGVVYQMRRYLLWFALGAVVNRGGPVRWLSGAPTQTLVSITILGAASAVWAVSMGARDVYATLLPFTLASATAQLSLAVLLERRKLLGFIPAWGRRSLEIYLAHVIFLAMARIALQRGLGIEAVPIHLAIGMFAGLYLPMGLYWASKRVGVPYLFSLKAR